MLLPSTKQPMIWARFSVDSLFILTIMLEPSDGTSAGLSAVSLLWTIDEGTPETSLFAGDFYARGRNLCRVLRLLTPVPATADKDIKSTRGDLGRGVYALSDLRAFVALDGKPADGKNVPRWLTRVLAPVGHQPWQADYSFSDLVSLFVVRELLKKGVHQFTIREAETYLRKKWKTDRPFVSDEIQTDGLRVLVDDEVIAGQIESADLHGQQVMRELVKDRLEHVEYHDGSAAYWLPAPGVVVDPRVQFGAPVVEGTRVPTDAVYGVVRQLGTERAIRRFDLSAKHIEHAIAFEDRLAALN